MIRILRYIKGTQSHGMLYENKVTLILLDIVMQIRQARLQTDTPLQDIVHLLEET